MGQYVLYRCGRNRRAAGNHALLFAAGVANRMRVPLLVYESLGSDYPYANDRLHTFVLEGVSQTAAGLHKLGAGYVFELLRRKGEKSQAGGLERDAAAVVMDDHPLDRGTLAAYGVARMRWIQAAWCRRIASKSKCTRPTRYDPEFAGCCRNS